MTTREGDSRAAPEGAGMRLALDANPLPVFIFGDEGAILYANAAALALLGAEASPPDFAALVVPAHRAAWRERHDRVCGGERLSWEFDNAAPDGRIRILASTSVPVAAPDGGGQQLAFIRDVTEPRRAEQRLRASEALLAAFMKHAPIGMYLKDSDGRYLMLNPEMEKVFRLPMAQVLGRTAADLLPAKEAADIAAFDREILAGGKARAVEEFLPEIDDYQWSLVVRFPVGAEGGGPRQIGGFDIDITDRKRAAEELAQSREALYQSEKMSALGGLLAGVSHELNNPLAILVTLSTLLEEDAQGTAFAVRAGKIRNAAERCARIVQSFLAMARQREPQRALVCANEIVRTAVELAGYGVDAHRITLRHEPGEGLPRLHADSDQLHQVIINLIVNAQQAFTPATAQPCITVRTSTDATKRQVHIAVADNGPGIPPETRRRMFDPFFTTKPQGKGVGLGLSLSLGIAEAHGGTIGYADQPGGGACFTLVVPAAADLLAVPATDAGQMRAGVRGHALVVDDEPDLAEALAALLEREALQVDVVLDGEAAKERLRARDYDVVLSDMLMPGLTGADLYRWMEGERPEAARRTAFVTGDTFGVSVARFLADAGRPVLEKPFTAESVRRLLAQVAAVAGAPS